MTIEEYKQKLISVVKDMEEEHGCKINRISISGTSYNNLYEFRDYEVEIEA